MNAKKRRYDESLFETEKCETRPMKRIRCDVHQEQTILKHIKQGDNVFITGSAGTGKSTILKKIISSLPSEGTFVTASTGIAATQIDGITLHSFAGIGLGNESKFELLKRVTKSKMLIQRWQNTEILIIDEISMIDGNLFDSLDYIAKLTRGINKPFGGIQVICCGDFLQLPPVSDKKDDEIKFCFESDAWRDTIHVCINLTTIFRQRSDEFIRVLEEVRQGVCSQFSKNKLMEKVIGQKDLERIDLDHCCSDIKPTKLFCLNKNVDRINNEELDLLQGEIKMFQAIDRGNKEHLTFLSNNAAPDYLVLKEKAQVMLTCNLNVKSKLCNGARGVVTGFEKCPDSGELVPRVMFADQVEMLVPYHTWKVVVEGKTLASRSQIPLKCAWALSVHKSQGQTLDSAIIQCDDVFEYGQMYVALSRVTSLDGLKLLGFNSNLIKAHPKVMEFYKKLN